MQFHLSCADGYRLRKSSSAAPSAQGLHHGRWPQSQDGRRHPIRVRSGFGWFFCSFFHFLVLSIPSPWLRMAGAPGVEPGSEESQSPMLSVTPCPSERNRRRYPDSNRGPGIRNP